MIALLTFALLSGSVLVVWQMVLVLVLFTLVYPEKWQWTLKTFAITGLLTLPITLPILRGSPYTHQSRVIFCGWGCASGEVTSTGLRHLWDGLTKKYTIDQDASWEQSLYVGPFVGIFVAFIYRFLRGSRDRLDSVFLAVAILSLGPIMGWLYNSTGLPVIDRLPTRLAIYPFTWFLVRALRCQH